MRSRQSTPPTTQPPHIAPWPLSHRAGDNELRRSFGFTFYFLAGTLALLVVFQLGYSLGYSLGNCHGSLARVSHGDWSCVARNGYGQAAMMPQEGDRPQVTWKEKSGDTGSLRRRRTRSAGQSTDWAKRPAGWKGYGMRDIRRHFRCRERDLDQSKPLTTPEEWQLMRTALAESIEGGEAGFLDDPVPPTRGYTLESEGGPPPFYAKRSPGRGRGLFARRGIRKGEVVHDGTASDFRFPDAMSYRRFVFSLPRDLACDVAVWNWTQEDGEGRFHHYLELNIASYMNSHPRKFNAIADDKTSSVMKATRDIAKDEEILTDYTIYKSDWKAVGL